MTITKKFSKKLNVLKTKKKSKRTKKKGMKGGQKVGHSPSKQKHVFTTKLPYNSKQYKPVLTTNPKMFNGTTAKNYFLGTGKEYRKDNRRSDRINTNNLIKQLQNSNHSTHRDIIIKSLSTKYHPEFVESASKNSNTFIELLKIAKQRKNSGVNPLITHNIPHYSSLNRTTKTSKSLKPKTDVYSIPSYGQPRPIEEPIYATLK